MRAVREGGEWRNPFQSGRIACRTAPGRQDEAVKSASPAAHHAVVSVRYLHLVEESANRSHALADAMRESAKAVTKVVGLEGTVKFCLELAQRLALTGARKDAE